MKATEVRALSDDQLAEQLVGLQREAFNLRFQKASGQLESTARSARSAAISHAIKPLSANAAGPPPRNSAAGIAEEH